MAIDVKKSIKPMVIKLRKQGFSYSEIQKEIYVPKATLSLWLKKLKLTETQLELLRQKKIRAAKRGSETKVTKTRKLIEEIQKSSSADVKSISPRELWLMGIVLYWRERFLNKNESDLRKGVSFTSSDPDLTKLFLKWLYSVGKLKKEEISFDIFLSENRREDRGKEKQKGGVKIAKNYWAKITDFPKSYFSKIYFLKYKKKHNKPGVKKRMVKKKIQFGMLRVRVKASSMLARQISGWIGGIRQVLNI